MKTILVVAGDEMRALIIRELGTSFPHAFSFIEAAHGQHALLELKKLVAADKQVLAVISEFKMSPLSGAGLIYQMDLQGYGIPVLFLSTKDVDDGIIREYSPHIIRKSSDDKAFSDALSDAIRSLVEPAPQG